MSRTSLVFDDAAGPSLLWPYGRAVWDSVRDDAIAWRRRDTGVALLRVEGAPEALWWAMLDGPFESKGGALDLIYRARALGAFLDDVSGPITAQVDEDDAWSEVLSAVCDARARPLTLTTRPARGLRGHVSHWRRVAAVLRRAVGSVARPRAAEVALVLAHGRMAVRGPSGGIVDRYTAALAPALRARFAVATVSLVPPNDRLDLPATIRGEYTPWTSLVPVSDLARYPARRSRWLKLLEDAGVFSLNVGGVDLSGLVRRGAVPLAARGLALAELYGIAFRNLAEIVGPKVAVTSEGHSNVGRMIGYAMGATRLFAPQAGIIGPGGETNAAYDHRALMPMTAERDRGCPVPDRTLVWGEHDASTLKSLGHATAHISITGLPRDIERVSDRRDSGYALYFAGANTDVLAFAYGMGEELMTIRAVREALPSGVPLVVRLHPSHDESSYRRLLPGVLLTHAARRPMRDDLANARVAIAKASTSLIEAGVAGIPVVCVNLGPAPDIWAFAETGIPYVGTAAELAPALAQALGGRRPTLEHLVACHGDRAVARVVDEVGAAL